MLSFTAGQSLPQPVQRVLSAGEKKNHPTHIPDHLPQFPDPHTYIRTEVLYHIVRKLVYKALSYKILEGELERIKNGMHKYLFDRKSIYFYHLLHLLIIVHDCYTLDCQNKMLYNKVFFQYKLWICWYFLQCLHRTYPKFNNADYVV